MIKIGGCEYITVNEAAEVLEVSPGRVRHFVTDGRLRHKRYLGRVLLYRKSVARFSKTRQRRPGPPSKG